MSDGATEMYKEELITPSQAALYQLMEDSDPDGDRADIVDMVNHPPHYNKGKVECIDAIATATSDLTGIEAVCTGNAIKYLWRWKQKGGVQDLDKAIWYINQAKESANGAS